MCERLGANIWGFSPWTWGSWPLVLRVNQSVYMDSLVCMRRYKQLLFSFVASCLSLSSSWVPTRGCCDQLPMWKLTGFAKKAETLLHIGYNPLHVSSLKVGHYKIYTLLMVNVFFLYPQSISSMMDGWIGFFINHYYSNKGALHGFCTSNPVSCVSRVITSTLMMSSG